MDEITLEMIKLLKQRTTIAKEIGGIKKDLGMSVKMKKEKIILEKKLFLCVQK